MTDSPRTHFAILGAGAVGLTLAAFLRANGQRVTLLTRDGTAPFPVQVRDEIGNRALVLRSADIEVRRSNDPPHSPDHLIVCTRAEQLAAALSELGSLHPLVPITNAAATLEDVPALARNAGVRNPLLVMAVGFAAWPTAERQLRVFALSPPGPVIAPLFAAKPGTAKELARLLASAGFPAQAPPPTLFRWVFRTMLAVQIPWMHAYRRAGWELDSLASAPELLGLCGAAMAESAHVVRGGGPLAVVAQRVPARLFTHLVTKQAREASPSFKDVWRYHGPKCAEQLVVLTEQLLEHARDEPMRALRELASG